MEGKKTLNLEKYLGSQGFSFSRVDDAGKYYVTTPDGEEKALNVQKLMESKGLDPKRIDVKFNSPETAIDQTPTELGILERAKLALGNTKGNINYLKSKFDDVSYSPDSGITIKDKGVWKKIDKSGMDPYELTADIVEGAVSLSPSLVGGTAGAIGGAALGGPVGAIGGSGIGAGVVEGIRGTLGRAVGTYDATPEEELKDIGWEILLNSGGEALALGARPLLSGVVKSVKNVTKQAPVAVQNMMAETLHKTTGAKVSSINTLFDAPEQTGKHITSALQKYGNTEAAKEGLKDQALRAVETLVEDAPKALTKKYGEEVNKMILAAPKNFSVNLKDVLSGAQKKIAESGLGSLDDGMLRRLTSKEYVNRLSMGEGGEQLSKEAASKVTEMFRTINELNVDKVIGGPNAVKAMMNLRRTINETAESLLTMDTPPVVKRYITQIKTAVTDQIGTKFAQKGMQEPYLQTSNLYAKYAKAVNEARRLAQDTAPGVKAREMLLNKLTTDSGRNNVHKGLTADMAELLGKRGELLLQSINVNSAASELVQILPKGSIMSSSITTAGAFGVASGMLPVQAAAGAVLASPRAVARGVQGAAKIAPYAKKVADTIRTMTPQARLSWLKNPQLVDGTIRTAISAASNEDNDVEQLLREAGVK